MKTKNKLFSYLPLAIAVLIIGYAIYFHYSSFPQINNLDFIDETNEKIVDLSINQITEANNFLISLITALFGVCGYFLNKYKSALAILPLGISYFVCLVLLGLSYYSGFRVHTEIINSVAQKCFALTPGYSYVLYYIEKEFIFCGGTSLCLLSILFTIFITSTKIKLT